MHPFDDNGDRVYWFREFGTIQLLRVCRKYALGEKIKLSLEAVKVQMHASRLPNFIGGECDLRGGNPSFLFFDDTLISK